VGFYEDRILPHLISWAMRNPQLRPYRERVTSAAEGRVLEIGIGSGLNVPLYPQQVREIVGVEPRELRFLYTQRGLVAFLTLGLEGDTTLDQAHARASEIEERIRRERPGIADVIVHTEP